MKCVPPWLTLNPGIGPDSAETLASYFHHTAQNRAPE